MILIKPPDMSRKPKEKRKSVVGPCSIPQAKRINETTRPKSEIKDITMQRKITKILTRSHVGSLRRPASTS